MKFTLSWLKEHLETTASADEVAAALTRIGLELEGMVDRSRGLEGFVVAEVVACRPHPDADKLRLCTLETGSGNQEVVCGAPNARVGLKAVFAAAGSYIPGLDITLKRAKIRGVESNGMLLSAKEMGFGDDHGGIIELPVDAVVGGRAVDALGLADPVFDISITPNRGDCLGVRGVARDLAAAGLGTLKPLDTKPVIGTFESPMNVGLAFTPDTLGACPYFVGRFIKGVSNGESPRWLKDRLTAIGLRPISALVDITNYISFDLCRPLHVFDAAKIHGGLTVRLAREGEKLQALDGNQYTLDETMTVIADHHHPQALAGIIGGEESGCGAATRDVFLEVAWFDPVRTAVTGRKLGILSDARYRFERGIDATFMVDATHIATRMILALCGGTASKPVIAGSQPWRRRAINLRTRRIRELTGVEVPTAEASTILERLGFKIEKTDAIIHVDVPPWRHDITGEACLIEEIIRIRGYDTIPVVPPERASVLPAPALDSTQRRRGLARRLLAERGLVEAVTYSFLSEADAGRFGGVPETLRLVNPISADLAVMRPSLLPNLIAAAGRNHNRGLKDAALFEVGPRFRGDAPEDEEMVAGGIRVGRTGHRHWAAAPRAVDAFDAKADAEAVLTLLGVPAGSLETGSDAPAWYHPGRSGTLRLGPKMVLAEFGELHPRTLAAMDVKGPIAGFEVFLDRLPRRKAKKGAARPQLVLSPFQPVERDFAFVVDDGVTAADVVAAARGADKNLIAEVRVFDLFSGGALGQGRKSLAITVVLRPAEKTLVEADIETVAAKIVEAVAKATGGALRS